MSGIPRDYRGINQYPQVIRGRRSPSAVFTVVIRELSREQTQAVVRELERAGALSAPRLSLFDMVVGNGAAKGNQADTHTSPPNTGGDASVSGDHGPSPQQPARSAPLPDGTSNETIREDADDLELDGWPGAAKRLRSLHASYDRLAEAGDSLAAAVKIAGRENGRMRSAITEAIALLENGSDYERMHVAGTLRGAL